MRPNFEVRRKGEDELIATAHFILAATESGHVRNWSRYPRGCARGSRPTLPKNKNDDDRH